MYGYATCCLCTKIPHEKFQPSVSCANKQCPLAKGSSVKTEYCTRTQSSDSAPKPKVGEIRALTGLRGVAATDVALLHIGGVAPLSLFAFHNQAVDIFFCLSGFTLSLAYRIESARHLNWKAFFAARFARVYPLCAIALILCTIYSAFWNLNNFSAYGPIEFIGDFVRQLLMINALPVIGSSVHWIAPMWSLSIEAFCYVAIFPILFAITMPAGSLSPKWRLAIILMLSGFTYAFYVLFMNPGVYSHLVPPATGPWIHWVAIVRGICMFTCGWLVYTLYTNAPAILNGAIEMVDIVVFFAALILVGRMFGVVDVALIVPLAPFLVLGISSGDSLTSRILSGKTLHYLGKISYSLYILHWPVKELYDLLGGSSQPEIRLAAIFIASLALSGLSYSYLETPMRIFLFKKITQKLSKHG